MNSAWWACHWCDWEAPTTHRLFDRYRAKLEFRWHIRHWHPDVVYDNDVLWGRKGQR